MFVVGAAAGSAHGSFQRAVERGNLPVALALTGLFARIGDARFEAAAVRWLGWLACERRLGLESLRLATAFVAALPDETDVADAHALLRSLARRRL